MSLSTTDQFQAFLANGVQSSFFPSQISSVFFYPNFRQGIKSFLRNILHGHVIFVNYVCYV